MRPPVPIVALLIPLLFACGRFGDGEGEVKGTVCADARDATDCNARYDMGPAYFALETGGGHALISLRTNRGALARTDILQFLVIDPAEVERRLSQPLPLDPAGLVRPQIQLIRTFGMDSCPLTADAAAATITFERFGLNPGDWIKARFEMPLIGQEDRRPRGHLEGSFSFEARAPEIPPNNSELTRAADPPRAGETEKNVALSVDSAVATVIASPKNFDVYSR